MNQRINAFITRCGNDTLEEETTKAACGPLAGVTVAVKDNICTRGIRTTCGSKMLADFIPVEDATVITRLKQAGAIIVGKTNMDEFAMGSSTETSYYGAVKNPWDLTRSPGGSSGGSAAAVAAGMAQTALGSDTGGSIRLPAAHCGVLGLKPTYGSVSRNGLIAYASSLDQIGPMGRRVEDVAAVLDVITGYDSMDSTSRMDWAGTDTLANLSEDLTGMRVGIPMEFMGSDVSKEIREAVYDTAEFFCSRGAVVSEMSLQLPDVMTEAYYIIACAQASSNLARFDGVRFGYRAADYQNLEELYCKSRGQGFGLECQKRIMMGCFALSAGYYDAYYKKALRVQEKVLRCYEEALQQYDILLSPVSQNMAPKLTSHATNEVSQYRADFYTIGANLAGIPAMSMPYCGGRVEHELPIGIQLVAGAFREQDLLNSAYAYERAYQGVQA